MRQELIVNVFKNNKPINSGLSCYYYKVRKGIGLKVYSLKEERDMAFELQKAFSRAGLAPKASRKIDFIDCFGYVTQSAPHDDNIKTECITNLLHKASSLGFYIGDLFNRNIGFLRGNPVFIDFGYGSNASTPPSY